jgi:hypothetical protein
MAVSVSIRMQEVIEHQTNTPYCIFLNLELKQYFVVNKFWKNLGNNSYDYVDYPFAETGQTIRHLLYDDMTRPYSFAAREAIWKKLENFHTKHKGFEFISGWGPDESKSNENATAIPPPPSPQQNVD